MLLTVKVFVENDAKTMLNIKHSVKKQVNSQDQVLAVILSASSSKNNSLLFRYPCDNSDTLQENGVNQDTVSHNDFAVKNDESYYEVTNQFYQRLGIDENGLITYSDGVLSTFLAVQSSQLANKPFDVKVDDVQFVGYPVSVKHCPTRRKGKETSGGSLTNVNVVFALPKSVSEASKACYHQLSQQVAMAIKHEESRCCYFCTERKRMESIIEDCTLQGSNDIQHADNFSNGHESDRHPSLIMLDQGLPLPTTLKNVFDKVSQTGIVFELMNNWTEINFCLPIKAHNLPFDSELCITEEDIDSCLDLLRPYHAMLLLVDVRSLIKSLPIDSSPALVRLLRVCSPKKNLQELAADSDLELSQVFKLVSHLVYWAKATVIYPLCEHNVYALSPNAPTSVTSQLVDEFSQVFPKYNLLEMLSDFSFPNQLDEHQKIIDDRTKKKEMVKIVIWMLKHRLLIQIHDYLYLKPSYCELEVLPNGERGVVLNEAGKEQLATVADSGSAARFSDLIKYFDGTRHIEDIMYYQNINRGEVSTVIDRFLPMLYKMQLADPATSYYAKT